MISKVVLITGITGFVGPYLASKLLDQGHTVYGLVQRRADLQKPKRLIETGILDQVKLITADVRDFATILKVVDYRAPDWIFHLASQSFVPQSFKDPLHTFEVNARGTQNLLEAVRLRSPDSRIIFAGSSEEYGLQYADELPIDENNLLRPRSPYAVSKVFGDYLCRNYTDAYSTEEYTFDTVVSRAFNHEGAGRGGEFVTASIVRQLIELKLGEIKAMSMGDITVTRDWSHVEDICDGYILLAEKGKSGQIYVQGSGIQTSVQQFIELVCEELDIPIPTVSTDCSKMRKSDVPRLQANIAKITKLGYKPSKTLKDVIKDLVNYYYVPENRKNILTPISY